MRHDLGVVNFGGIGGFSTITCNIQSTLAGMLREAFDADIGRMSPPMLVLVP